MVEVVEVEVEEVGGGGGGEVVGREERREWVAISFSRTSWARSFLLSGVGRPLLGGDGWDGRDDGGGDGWGDGWDGWGEGWDGWGVGERVPAPMPR